VTARSVLSALAAVILVLAGLRIHKDSGQILPLSRTWLTIGIIFATVSAYLWITQ
jgi:hypothetical protein